MPDVRWLPFAALLRRRRFPRLQECRDDLVQEPATREAARLFVSHRWLATDQPDPDGRQARFVIVQIVSAVLEAVHVAARRGLHEPRLEVPFFPAVVGVAGSELAEELLVSVLRPLLDERQLAAIAAETRELGGVFDSMAAAPDASDVDRIALALEACPGFAALLETVHLWYDYTCLPQKPRTAEEDALVRRALGELFVHQAGARTLIVVDDLADYLSRGWCTAEALASDRWGRWTLTLQPDAASRGQDDAAIFENVLHDRPHVVWRALLDTEVLGVHTPAECVRRLGLAVTDPDDLPLVYSWLRAPAPRRLHTDVAELLTGVVPLLTESSQGLSIIAHEAGPLDRRAPDACSTLDWTAALDLDTWSQRSSTGFQCPPPFVSIRDEPQESACHAAVIASCEGEAAMLATWLHDHLEDLEQAIGQAVTSTSWLAVDVAPVGSFPLGTLRAEAVDAARWVIIAGGLRFSSCDTTRAITNVLARVGCGYVELSVDQDADNVAVYDGAVEIGGSFEPGEIVVAPVSGFPTHTGGLLRPDVADLLVVDTPGLRDALEHAVDLGDRDALVELVRRGWPVIQRLLELWLATDRFADCQDDTQDVWGPTLRRVVAELAAAGVEPFPELARDASPPDAWESDFDEAKALGDAGRYAESLAALEVLRTSADAPATLPSHFHGLLGTNLAHLGDTAGARAATALALELAEADRDEVGVRIYRATLAVLDRELSLAGDPELRDVVCTAQSLSDDGQYKASSQLLRQALGRGPERRDVGQYAGKIYGLLGFNAFRRGKRATARRWTARALEACTEAGDHDGTVIYTANLEAMGAQGHEPPTESL